MMRKVMTLVLTLVACAVVPAANAQQRFPLSVPVEGASGNTIQVSVNYSLSVPLGGDDEKAQSEALEKGRRLVYGIAASECKVLEETIASSCRMERLNVQSNVQRGSRSTEQIHVGASANYRISLK